MKTNVIKRSLVATLLVASVFSVTACSPASDSSSITRPSYIHGDVIDNVIVKDQYGEYMSTKLAPDAKALVYNKGRNNTTVYDAGFTDADAKSAQEFIANWVAEQGTDSIVLDNTKQNDAWMKAESKYFGGENKTVLVENVKAEDSSVIVNRLPLTVRDKQTRVIDNSINIYGMGAISAEQVAVGDKELTEEELDKISVKNTKGEKYLQVYGIADTIYRITNQNLENYLIEQSGGKLTKEDLENAVPEFKDGKEKKIVNQFQFTYTLKKVDKGWEIIGTSNTFNWNWIS